MVESQNIIYHRHPFHRKGAIHNKEAGTMAYEAKDYAKLVQLILQDEFYASPDTFETIKVDADEIIV